jgi:hypothetical protein
VQTLSGGSATASKGAAPSESTLWQSTAAKADWHANKAKNAPTKQSKVVSNLIMTRACSAII